MSSGANGQGYGATDSSGKEGETQVKEVIKEEAYDHRPCLFRYITAITRLWGILTLAGIWYCAVELMRNREKYHYTQYYTLCVAIIVTFFEFAWLFNKMACCKDDGNCCCTLWRMVMWFDNWKKSILYIIISIPEFLKGWSSYLAVISGILVLVLAVFYFLKSFKYSKCVEQKRVKTTKYIQDPETALLKEQPAQSQDVPSAPNEADLNWEKIRQGSGEYQPPPPTQSYDTNETTNPFDSQSYDKEKNPFGED